MTRDSLMSMDCATLSSPTSSPSSWYLVDGDSRPASRDSERPISNLSQPDDSENEDRQGGTQEKGHTKLKKRVSFPETDDELVSIREIPSRDDVILSEELSPCDPAKLAEEMESTVKLDSSSRRYECSSKSTGRSLSIVAEITGLNVYGSPLNRSVSKIAARQLSQNLRKSKDSDYIRSAERSQRQKKIAIKQFSSDDICDKMRVAPPKEKSQKSSKRQVSSAKKEHRERTKKQKSPTGGCDTTKHTKPKVYSFEPLSQKGDAKPPKVRNRQTLTIDGTNLNVGEPLMLPEVLSPRVLASPYRQSYGVIPGIQQRPYSTPSFGHVKTESGFIFPNDTSHALRIKSAGDRPQEITIETRSEMKTKQKVYAWNLANGTAAEVTPCISPMWDMTKPTQSADSVKIT